MQEGKKRLQILTWILAFSVLFYFVNRQYHFVHLSIEDGKIRFVFMEETIDSMEELAKEVNARLQDGEEEVNVVIKDITDEEIEEINSYLGGFWGDVVTYGVTSHKSTVKRNLQLELELSDNYYVYRNYVYGEPIPGNISGAEELVLKVRIALAECLRPGMTDYEKELAIYEYILTHCTYGFLEENTDDSYNVYGALLKGKAVCNGYAQAFMLLCSCAGLETRMIYGDAGGESHAWNCVKLDGEWYMVDVTWDDPIPDVSGRKYYAYFNVTSDYLRVNHIWNEECFPECTAKKYNYFYYNDLVCKDVSGLKGKIDTLLSEKKNIEMQFRIENMGENISLQNIANQGNVREIAWQVEKAGPDGVIWVEIKGR